MNDTRRETTFGRKLTALTAALAVGLGVTLTGCAPDEVPPPADPGEQPGLPGQPIPDQPASPEPEPPEEPEEEPQY